MDAEHCIIAVLTEFARLLSAADKRRHNVSFIMSAVSVLLETTMQKYKLFPEPPNLFFFYYQKRTVQTTAPAIS